MNLDTGYLSFLCRTETSVVQQNLIKRYAKYAPVFEDGYIYVKRGRSNVLAIAHLDTVLDSDNKWDYVKVVTEKDGVKTTTWERAGKKKSSYPAEYREFKTQQGKVVNSISLDDRLGVWVLTQVLESMGILPDLLFTTGEEIGQSTAQLFIPPADIKYNWMFQFDRREEKPVMYEYDDQDMRDRLRSIGVDAGFGSFSDICYMGHLGIKGINWGTCYNNEHGVDCWANLRLLQSSIQKFKKFWKRYNEMPMEHVAVPYYQKYLTGYEDMYDTTGYTWQKSTESLLSEKERHILEAMQDDTTHEEYRMYRALVKMDGDKSGITNEFCDICHVALYVAEVAHQKCGLCQSNTPRPRCSYCSNFLYGEEMFRDICQDCAEWLREDEDEAREEWGLEKEDAGLWVTCADCSIVMGYKSSTYIAGLGHLCGKCSSARAAGHQKEGMMLPLVKAAKQCFKCGQSLFEDEYQYGICADCQEIAALKGGG